MEIMESTRKGRESRNAQESQPVDKTDSENDKKQKGGWSYAYLLLSNQGLATLAFFGVGMNLVLFLTRVLGQNNAIAANNVSIWTGTVYLCSLVGAFLSDSYWGRYLTCAIFQVILVLGMTLLSVSSWLFLVKPKGCGNGKLRCQPPTSVGTSVFYLAIYLTAFGYGGHQPTIATFGSDQFDDSQESSKAAFFSYFYFSLKTGTLFSNTILVYFEDNGKWTAGFWASTAAAVLALVIFLLGSHGYRYMKPCGNPIPRVFQVFVAAAKKWHATPKQGEQLHEVQGELSAIKGSRKIGHTNDLSYSNRSRPALSAFKSVAALHYNPSGGSEMHHPDDANLAVHGHVLGRVHPNGLPFRRARRRNGHPNRHIPPPRRQHVSVRHLQRPPLHHIIPPALRPGGEKVHRQPPRPDGTPAHGRRPRNRNAGDDRRRLNRIVEAQISEPGKARKLHERVLADPPVRVDRHVGGLHVCRATGVLQRAGAGRDQELWELAVHGVDFGREFRQQLPGQHSDECDVVEQQPRMDSGGFERGHMDRFYFLLAVLAAVDFFIYLACANWYKCRDLHGSGDEGENNEEQEATSRV
ncbi:UNVERIFIED_CONTAM: protein NRT1/ PTR FAMILY 7.1 [Sesamum radiatum]|uniref:Protein NRT1/ PTR FAMILY 7.1 n=1 Tax=Sesamum radiatum TaxID=300843 RepID=A0AAW2W741_SESRA